MTRRNDKLRQRHAADARQQAISFGFDDTLFDDDSPAPQKTEPQEAPHTSSPSKDGNEWSIQFASFGSGSSGNCAFLGVGNQGVLIDAGVTPDKVFPELARNGIMPSNVKGIVLTHDHADHVRYAYKMVRTYKHLRIYCTPKLMRGILTLHKVSRRIQDHQESIFKEIPFKLGGMTFTAFETSHDAFDNMGFMVEAGNHKFVVATDMGVITERAAHYMSEATCLMIESNYDRRMLDAGSYPEYLKARVRGPKGHLDNEEAARFVSEHYHDGLQHIFLCHLSNDNNTPQLALAAMTGALTGRGLTVGDASNAVDQRDRDVQLYALPRYDTSTWFLL